VLDEAKMQSAELQSCVDLLTIIADKENVFGTSKEELNFFWQAVLDFIYQDAVQVAFEAAFLVDQSRVSLLC